MFGNYKFTTSSGKHLEDMNHTHIASLIYKLITSYKDSDDLFFGFDRNRNRRQRELTYNKNQKGKFYVRNMLKVVFCYAQEQQKAIFGLGYKLTLARKSENAVLNKNNAINNVKIKINRIEWYVPHYAASISLHAMLSKQILSRTAS